MRTPPLRMQGFTIVELMVTIGIVAILSTIAIPSLNTFIQNQRLATATNSLVLALNFARSEAIKRSVPNGITVCASSDQQTCNGATWSQGWVVEDVTNASGPLQAAASVGANDTVAEAAGQLAVVFLSNGATAAAASFRICDSRGGPYAHSIDVSSTGRVLSAQTPGFTVYGVALGCP
jgi:type IV fimbrial biogenesis protein FimT